jgi:uncharacterized protein (DUF488 family)
MKKPRIYTIGHSTRSFREFAELLSAHGVKTVVDVRSIPRSRHNPQFNESRLERSLTAKRIGYRRLKRLGGLRHARKDSMNLGWHNASFRGYADYMGTPGFSAGLNTLMKIAKARPTAVMCAEAVPWRCHRSMIADALIKEGWLVLDIMSRTSVRRRRLTPFLKVKKGKITYPSSKT